MLMQGVVMVLGSERASGGVARCDVMMTIAPLLGGGGGGGGGGGEFVVVVVWW
jgi:hypothetical protein